ncbi:MAG: hypothetical protein HY054_09265 [Proteobacteria bacterium]|nr:hypothetical protein [Pseudomonadota bacterium]
MAVVALTIVILYLPVAWWFGLWPLQGTPFFPGQTRDFGCYLAAHDQTVHVVFSENGHIADVSVDGRHARMRYQGSRHGFDVYQGGGAQMTLDPEVVINGLGPDQIGPCQ